MPFVAEGGGPSRSRQPSPGVTSLKTHWYKRSILIVEDDTVAATGLTETLGMLGYQISGTVSTGEEALLQVEEKAPQTVLMDISLRGILDGVEAAQQIRSRFDVPAVYLTGFSDQALLDRAMETEPYGYLVKPIEIKR
jgi:CheY-like chemotaxis protein